MGKLFNFEPLDDLIDPPSKSSWEEQNEGKGEGCVFVLILGAVYNGVAWGFEVLSHYREMELPYSVIAAFYYFLLLALSDIWKLSLNILFWPFYCRYTEYILLDCLIAIVFFLAQLFGFWIIREVVHYYIPGGFRIPRLVKLLFVVALIAPAILAVFLKGVEFLTSR